ncbi:hypothetical protein VHEMI04306 [[Torrubiella] hemipterigena]|uniref:Tat pathway signal sequence n=1 Tax=[Torrubiella] hemipterigena TaxID=1531966 RepID=A0A0A1TDF6_9HYPO|nr:hypothetical protein VHEMI04306 [[Torrubiella] hemipterigena]
MIKVKQVKFTGGIKFAEDGTAYRHVEPGTTQYVGKPSDEIDLAWEELIRGQVVDLIGDEAKDWVNKTTRHHGQWYPVGADVFHQLHCVNMLRRNLNPEYYKPYNPEPLHTEHMYHCLDYLRQGVMCQSDLTPMYFEYSAVRHRTRQVQETWHTCRDFDRIQAWSLARDYDAHLDGPRTHEH